MLKDLKASRVGRQELRLRIREYNNSIRDRRRQTIENSCCNFLEANTVILTPLDIRRHQIEWHKQHRLLIEDARIARNFNQIALQDYRLANTTSILRVKKRRDEAFGNIVREMVSHRSVDLKNTWIGIIVLALRLQTMKEVLAEHRHAKSYLAIMRASALITRLIKKASSNRRRQEAADVIYESLKSFSEMSQVKRVARVLVWSVRILQRRWRVHQFLTSEHLTVLRRQWDVAQKKLEPKEKDDQDRQSQATQRKPQKQGGQRGKVRKKNVLAVKKTPGPVVIPDSTKNRILGDWLLGKRQEYVLTACRFEKYELWPQLVEYVAGYEPSVKGRTQARQFCEVLKRRGKMLSFLLERGQYVRGIPRMVHLVEESQLREMVERSITQIRTAQEQMRIGNEDFRL